MATRRLARTSRKRKITRPSLPMTGGKVTFNRSTARVLEVYFDKAKQWRFRAKARNGEIVATGEDYTRKWSAARGGQRLFPQAELRFLSAE